jgi:hypothetical protein
MMKMVVKKSVLLLGVVLALCAFTLPSVASAASWSPAGTTDGRIDVSTFGFSNPVPGWGMSCAATSFGVTVDSAAVATITSASFVNCYGDLGALRGCTVTAVGTNFPWRTTAVTTTNIQIDGFDVDLGFETTAGTLDECAFNGLQAWWTRTLTSSFTPGAAGSRTFDFKGGANQLLHFPGSVTMVAVMRGSGVATGLLNILDG